MTFPSLELQVKPPFWPLTIWVMRNPHKKEATMGIGWYWMIQYWSSIGNYWTHERLRISTRMPVAHKFRIDTRCAKRIKMVDGLPRYSTCPHFGTMAAEETCTIVDVICQNLGRRVFSTIYVIYVLRVFMSII